MGNVYYYINIVFLTFLYVGLCNTTKAENISVNSQIADSKPQEQKGTTYVNKKDTTSTPAPDSQSMAYLKSLPLKEVKVCFFNAIWSSDITTVKNIIAIYPKLINAKDTFGRTPLFFAVSNKDKNLAELLLKYKADPNATNCYGETPFFEAIKTGKLSIVKLLLKHGAKINKTNKKKQTVLMKCAFLGYTKIAKFLIKKRVDINARDKYGNTALHIAAKRGKKTMVSLLLRYGADKSIKNKFKHTPYDVAKTEKIKQLLR